MIRLELKPPNPAEDPLARLERRLPGVLRQALERALETGLAAARQRLQGGGGPRERSGRLLGSLSWEIGGSGNELTGQLHSDAPHAGVQEYGALIQARRAKYLKFRVEGRWVQVRRARVPARPFLRPGAEAAVAALEEEITRALMEEMS